MSFYGDRTNMYGLRADELYEIQTTFHEFDVDHDGYITSDEVRQCLRRCHIPFRDSDIQRTLSQMDFNRDGRVSYDEYMKYTSELYLRGRY